jgi:precorrin isomerase
VQIHFSNTETKRLKAMAKRDPKNSEVVVVIGGGPAAQESVESLRNRPKPFTGNR